MKVRAIEAGFYGGQRRREGEVFEFHGEKPGRWMELADKPAQSGKPEKAPDTLSEITRQQHDAEQSGIRRKSAA